MSAASDWLRKRGGYYSCNEISRAIGRLKGDTQKMLDKGVESGELESREWALDRLATDGTYTMVKGEPYRQYRVVELKADAA